MLKYAYALLMLSAACSISSCKSKPPKKDQQIDINSPRRAYVDKHVNDEYRLNRDKLLLKGKVTRIDEFVYDGVANDTTMPGYKSKEYMSFDTAGNLTERLLFKGKAFTEKRRASYSTSKLCTAIEVYAADGKLKYTEQNEFDPNDHLLEVSKRVPGEATEIEITARYDRYGAPVKEVRQGNVYEYENTFSDDGLLIAREVTFNKNPEGKILWKYDSIGNMIEQQIIMKNDQVFSRSSFKHNDKGKIIRQTSYQDGKEETRVFSYDSLGNSTEQANLDVTKNMKYNGVENIYEYDKQGNWVKLTVRPEDGIVKMTIIRKIYY